MTYAYDADGNMLTAQDSGGTTTYTYNSLDQLSSLTDEAGDLWNFHYNPAGERDTTWFDTNAGNTSWAAKMYDTFDAAGRITEIQDYRASSTVVSDVKYSYTKYTGATACAQAPAITNCNFTTQDANSYLDNPANGNRYAYAGDNPCQQHRPHWRLQLLWVY